MSNAVEQNELGYFGKLPSAGDFIHQVLPLDFTNPFHEWMQRSMAGAREALGDDFLTYYLNCPSWKFVTGRNVCGAQAVAGVTIPSVDKVGRYFNFTVATVLPIDTNPIAYVFNNKSGFQTLELLALEILESDYTSEQVALKVQETTQIFQAVPVVTSHVDTYSDHLSVSLDLPLPFADQAGALLSHFLVESLGEFSIWWYGQEGQTLSKMAICGGMPSVEVYTKFLTPDQPPEMLESDKEEMNYVDQIITGEI